MNKRWLDKHSSINTKSNIFLYLSILIMDDEFLKISLNQGKQFNKYQEKIKNSIEKSNSKINLIEEFVGMHNDDDPNKDIIKERIERAKTISSDNQLDQNKLNRIQEQYNSLVDKYSKTEKTINSDSLEAIDRISPKNQYLNKNIKFSTGQVCHVTNQGIAKLITSQEIWNSLKNCSGKTYIDVNLPWLSDYNVPGKIIPTVPSLISGTKMVLNQGCGNEGKNVYVSKLTDSTNTTYMGCYGDENGSAMTFIGGAPLKQQSSSIQNGNFSQPERAKNSFVYMTTSSSVPGWKFNNAVLLNNSTAWGYPIPYPNGNQCACIQSTASFEQIINLSIGSYTLSMMACGRPGYSGANTINIQLNGVTFFSVTPPNKWTSYSTNFNVTTSGNNTIKFLGTIASVNNSTAFQGITLNSGGTSTNGTYTYEMCKNAAIDDGYKYFALQNVNTNTNKGYCAVSNDYVSSTRKGTANIISKVIALWNSKTHGTGGTSAGVTDKGTLSVFNSSGAVIFNTPSDKSLVSGGYIGCYNDKRDRAMINTSSGKYLPLDECKKYAEDGKYKYYGAQHKDGKDNGWCVASNDLTSSKKYGVANNCTKNRLGQFMGGGWSNSIYSMDGSASYFLILQDDGNMVVYKGTGPSDNQGVIWSSKTNGLQQKSNPLYTAKKGKYGRNWMASGSTLAKGDFIGSNNGSIYLIMQSDGNLVLYTSQTVENCKKISNGKYGGGEKANALYEFEKSGVLANLGKVAYIDADSNIKEYPSSLLEKSNEYQILNNFDSIGNDISNTTTTTAEKGCIDSCNANKDCSGFVYQPNGKMCYLKNSSMFPVGKKQYYQDSGLIMGIRKPKIGSTVNDSCTRDIIDIDTIQYSNYIKGDKMASNTQCQSDIVSQKNKNALIDVQKQIYTVGENMAKQSNDLYVTDKDIDKTISTNSSQFKENVDMYNQNNKNIKKELSLSVEGMSNMDSPNKNLNMNDVNSMLNDTDIRVLQENYSYIFWSILAVGILTITVSKIK
jgi:hypothetical protein